jgi:hypothetical protein
MTLLGDSNIHAEQYWSCPPFSKEIAMQIEVQYEDRYLKLPDMIKFKSGLRKIVIDVPDDALEQQGPPIDPVLDSLLEMLGTDYSYRPSGKSDKDLLGEALQEKYSL